MITRFEYGTGNKETSGVKTNLTFDFAVSNDKLTADEYSELIDVATKLKNLQERVAKRVKK